MFCAGYGLTGSLYTIERALKVHFPGLATRLIEQGTQESLLGPSMDFNGGHKPLIVQLGRYLAGVAQGDLGQSFYFNKRTQIKILGG